ncbi:MAG: hypothetical protein PHQ62_01535 [Clostridia bacterium]|nr:hypothetical protein [Clostridia bacterium]
MSGVSAWVLSIVGIIVLSIVVDLILPKSSTADFIKNIFAYVIIIVIISPIFSFLSNKSFNFEDLFSKNEIILQEDFLSTVNKQLVNSLKSKIEVDTQNNGLLGVEVGLTADIFEKKLKITKVSVDLKKMVIQDNFEHINIKTSIIQSIQKYVEIEKEFIVFYE